MLRGFTPRSLSTRLPLSDIEEARKSLTRQSSRRDSIPFARITADNDFDRSSMWAIATWNICSLRSMMKPNSSAKGKTIPVSSRTDTVKAYLAEEQPDVLMVQETKINTGQESVGSVNGYRHVDAFSTAKRGYSGTRSYIKASLNSVHWRGIPKDVHGVFGEAMKCLPKSPRSGWNLNDKAYRENEGRIVTTLVEQKGVTPLLLVNTYVPNSGEGLRRLSYRVGTWDKMLEKYLIDLQECAGTSANVILGGDMNVAERDYDRHHNGKWPEMIRSAGFTPEERCSFRVLLEKAGMVDAFRHLYPKAADVYTYWGYRHPLGKYENRNRNHGWRLDYFLVPEQLAGQENLIVDVFPQPKQLGSDHCPLMMWLRK